MRRAGSCQRGALTENKGCCTLAYAQVRSVAQSATKEILGQSFAGDMLGAQEQGYQAARVMHTAEAQEGSAFSTQVRARRLVARTDLAAVPALSACMTA